MQHKLVGFVLIIVFVLGIYGALKIAPNAANSQSSVSEQSLSERTTHLSWYPQARALSDFSLSQQNGENFSTEDLLGHWTLVFVGYTYCPDICPATLSEMNRTYPTLKQHETTNPLKIWFLSIDPKRDTLERLNEYINYFNPEFTATTGPHDQLFPLVRSMGMMYSMSDSTDNPNYLVDHSASIVVINPDAQVVGRFQPKHVPGQLATSDMQQIIEDMPILLASE